MSPRGLTIYTEETTIMDHEFDMKPHRGGVTALENGRFHMPPRFLSIPLSILLLLFTVVQPSLAQSVGGKVFAPYILTNSPVLVSTSQSSGIKVFTIAFVISDSGCQASLNGTALAQENSMAGSINNLRAIGGDVIISFGGAGGQELALTCGTVSSLQSQYQAVINKYNVKALDFDVEGSALDNTSANDRRNAALAALQTANPGLVISYTLPVGKSGLEQNSINLLQNAQVHGVHVNVVNIMTMDYANDNSDMGANAITASNGTISQLQSIGIPSALGITPMIGLNDTAPETFTLSNASAVRSYADSHSQVDRISFWSVGRDRQCSGTITSASDNCSGVTQSTWDFAHMYTSFGGSTPPPPSIDPTAWYNVVNENSGSCVDARKFGTANGTIVQQWACGNQQVNQEWQFQPTSGGFFRVAGRNAPTEVWDVTHVGTANGSLMQTWTYGGGLNQQWQPVDMGNGFFKFVARNSGRCLDVPAASTTNGVQLQIFDCNGSAAQSFKLVQQP
jgi:chitinase